MAPVSIARSVVIEGKKQDLLVISEGEGYRAVTVVDSIPAGGWTIGGARAVSGGTITECSHLAANMTEKCESAGIPAGGQKTVIDCLDHSILADGDRKVAIMADHAREVLKIHAGALFGPDMNIPEQIQDRLAELPGLADHFTGLSEARSGLAIDKNGYTGAGVAEAVDRCAKALGLRSARVAIQGFGAVGSHAGVDLVRRGHQLVAICNAQGSVTVPKGTLEAAALAALFPIPGDAAVLDSAIQAGAVRTTSPDDIFKIPADILIPAARTMCLSLESELPHARAENRGVLAVEAMYEKARWKGVVEGANHPISPAAREWLQAKGVLVCRDVLVNCGGLIACWIEWEARRAGRVVDAAVASHARATVSANISRNVEKIIADFRARR